MKKTYIPPMMAEEEYTCSFAILNVSIESEDLDLLYKGDASEYGIVDADSKQREGWYEW